MLKERSTEGIDVGVRVFNLADLAENSRNGIEAFSSQIADIIVLDMLIGESLQVHEPRIGVPEDSVAIARDNSAFLQGLVDELFDLSLAWLFSFMELFQIG